MAKIPKLAVERTCAKSSAGHSLPRLRITMFRLPLFLILGLAALSAFANSSLSFGPFRNVDLGKLDPAQRAIIVHASEDFDRVLRGKRPKHATFDKHAPLPADGGTEYFIGNGYKVTIVKSLSSFGALNGYVYGPVLSFDKSFAPGNISNVSSLRFYTHEQLKHLLSGK